MKKISICIIVLFAMNSVDAQLQEGAKLLTTSLSNLSIGATKSESTSNSSPTLSTKGAGFGFTLEGTYGEVKKNSVWAYGLNLYWRLNTQGNGGPDIHYMNIGPVVSYQKFYPITERLYVAPLAKFLVSYQSAKTDATSTSSALVQRGIAGSLNYHPFSLCFFKNQKTGFFFMLGNVSISYDRTKSYHDPSIADAKTISSNILLSASVSGVSFGVQKIL